MCTIFITGGTGCIGSATIYHLLKSDKVKRIVVATRSINTNVLKFWLGENTDPRVEFEAMDMSDYDVIGRVVARINPSHIIHLGAYQSPDCSKYHTEGMSINVGGTMALLDAAEKLPSLQRFVFASSAAVYGMRDMYAKSTIKEDVALSPPNHYGIWKLAGEHLARLFYEYTKIPTICLRLNTTYGKGRDKGKTAAPTNAMKAIAIGAVNKKMIPFEMPYKGRENYHFVEDVGAHFSICSLSPYDGYGVFNIKGQTITIDEFLNIIKQEAETLGIAAYTRLSIAENAEPNLFVADLSHEKIEKVFSNLPLTSIQEGVSKSLSEFLEMAKQGKLNK